MQQFEKDYAKLITKILQSGEVRKTRNGETRFIFGEMLTVPMNGIEASQSFKVVVCISKACSVNLQRCYVSRNL